jgi:hypothetical protein
MIVKIMRKRKKRNYDYNPPDSPLLQKVRSPEYSELASKALVDEYWHYYIINHDDERIDIDNLNNLGDL